MVFEYLSSFILSFVLLFFRMSWTSLYSSVQMGSSGLEQGSLMVRGRVRVSVSPLRLDLSVKNQVSWSNGDIYLAIFPNT